MYNNINILLFGCRDPLPHTNPGRKPHKDNNRVNGEVCTTPRKQSPRSRYCKSTCNNCVN